MDRIKSSFVSIEQVQNQYLKQGSLPSREIDKTKSFSKVLSDKIEDKIGNMFSVRFSKHALNRLAEREISLSPEQSERLSKGINEANQKGINDSLVMVDKLLFIVNVPSNTVVTAMDDESTTGHNVFTNIDGAVIA